MIFNFEKIKPGDIVFHSHIGEQRHRIQFFSYEFSIIDNIGENKLDLDYRAICLSRFINQSGIDCIFIMWLHHENELPKNASKFMIQCVAAYAVDNTL